MTDKYGIFSWVPHIAEGPEKQAQAPDQELGLNFKATVGKTGKNNDATFDSFKLLFEGERWRDPSRPVGDEGKNVSDAPFKEASPTKKSNGLGDYYGTLGGKIPYIAECPGKKLMKGEVPNKPLNFVTGPGKKGTYGFNKTTLSERQGATGVVGEYKYEAEPLALEIEKRRAARLQWHKKKVTDAPFRMANPPKKGTYGMNKTTIGNLALGVAGEYAYAAQGDPEKPPKRGELTPFRPTSLPKNIVHGHKGTFHKFPDYVADPESLKQAAITEERQRHHAQLAGGNPWRPSQTTNKVDVSPSVMRMNIRR